MLRILSVRKAISDPTLMEPSLSGRTGVELAATCRLCVHDGETRRRPSGFQLGTVLPPRSVHSVMSADAFGWTALQWGRGCYWHLWIEAGVLLNIPQHTGNCRN